MTALIALNNVICRGMLRALLAFALYGSFNFAVTPTRALPAYDGLWSVLIVTEKGDCDRGYRYPIRITRGVLSNAGGNDFTIIGKVALTGLIQVTVSRGGASASGVGRLAGNLGGGSWSGASCSGTWTAERRSL